MKVKVEFKKTLKCGKKVWRRGEYEMSLPLDPDLQHEIDIDSGKVRIVGQPTPTSPPADSGAKVDLPPKDPVTWTKSKLARLKKDELVLQLQPFKEELGDLNDMTREKLFEHAQEKLLK